MRRSITEKREGWSPGKRCREGGRELAAILTEFITELTRGGEGFLNEGRTGRKKKKEKRRGG